MSMELNYEEDIFIDESSLDVEWLNQPLLMQRYSREFAKAEKEVAKLKEKLSVTKATLDKDIRTNPSQYKISVKLTEEVVKNAIITDPEYQEQVEDLIEA